MMTLLISIALCLLALCGPSPASAQEALTSPPVDGSGAVKIGVSFLLVDVMVEVHLLQLALLLAEGEDYDYKFHHHMHVVQ